MSSGEMSDESLTERQKIYKTKWRTHETLTKLVPEKCIGCSWLSAFVTQGLSTKVAKDTLSESDAASALLQRVSECSGSKTNLDYYDASPICDLQEQEKRSGWVS